MTTESYSPGGPPARPGASPRTALAATAVALVGATAVYAPVLRHMARHWSTDDSYSHGFVVAPLALYFAWERRHDLARTAFRASVWGVPVLAAGVLALAVGRLGVEQMSMRTGFVLTCNGLVLLLLGRDAYRVLAFPLLFLFLMIPLPQSLVNVVSFPLQLFAADMAVRLLHELGIPALREGNIIHLAEVTLFVQDACSGLRSLMALLTLGVVFAYFFRKSWLERGVIVLSTLPIAILVNALRVALTGILTHRFGQEMAEGAIHETEGLFTFGLAFALLLAEAALLARLWPRPGGPGRPAEARP